MAIALKLPEQVAVQYFACKEDNTYDICYYNKYDLQPSSYKFLLKNKSFQIEADSDEKTTAAMRTFDLDFLKEYLEQVKPDLNEALKAAVWIGFTEAVKLLVSDDRVDPSARDNEALALASQEGNSEIVKLLLSDARFDPSAHDNEAIIAASHEGRLVIAKLLLSDDRVDPSARDNAALVSAARFGHSEILKLLKSHPRFRA